MKTIEFTNIGNSAFEQDEYAQFLHNDEESFNSPLATDLRDSFNKIIVGAPLTEDQEKVLRNIYDQFLHIQQKIDPERLKGFSYSFTEDDDLILSRNTAYCLINLVIHPEEDFTLSIIKKQEKEDDKLEFYDNDSADYEEVVYSFLIG